MDQMIITDLIARGVIGVNDWERQVDQEMVINAVLFIDLKAVGESDDLAQGLSYSTVARRLQQHAETAQRFTLEALATDLANLCLEYPGVRKARIRVEKPGAVRFARSVGVEIERSTA
ncbi:MAG: dihydroneopterin aldolase [Chloroflexi bacterium]|nr:dihydroneopterin aldolase [Chloroflexota bacterium]